MGNELNLYKLWAPICTITPNFGMMGDLMSLSPLLPCRLIAHRLLTRSFSTSLHRLHENPLGLPKNTSRPAPTLPRKGGPPAKRPIANVRKVVAVASGKGGVGKSTVAGARCFILCSILLSTDKTMEK